MRAVILGAQKGARVTKNKTDTSKRNAVGNIRYDSRNWKMEEQESNTHSEIQINSDYQGAANKLPPVIRSEIQTSQTKEIKR
jgi:hypothetical protein